MREDTGTVDVLLLMAMLGLTLVPAAILASLVDQLDASVARIGLYAAALAAAWRAYRVADVLLGLDERVKRLEDGQHVVERIASHLGIPTNGERP